MPELQELELNKHILKERQIDTTYNTQIKLCRFKFNSLIFDTFYFKQRKNESTTLSDIYNMFFLSSKVSSISFLI